MEWQYNHIKIIYMLGGIDIIGYIIWEYIKEIKSNWSFQIGIFDFEGNDRVFENLIRSPRISNNLKDLEATLNLSNISSEPMRRLARKT